MYCNSCGKFVESGSVFCTGCGKKINDPVVTSEPTKVNPPMEAAAAPVEKTAGESLLDMMAPIKEEPDVTSAPVETPASVGTPVSSGTLVSDSAPVQPTGIYEKEPPLMPYVPEMNKSVPEKTYFGKGALAFCLVVIGLLAISTGVFAGLYFSLL